MTDDKTPQPDNTGYGAGQGWTVLSYLISGMLVWGFVGWLVDRWLHTGGIAIAVGSVVGAGLGIYLILKRLNLQ
jgi:F0F1-type ATP synthase assembly protein I